MHSVVQSRPIAHVPFLGQSSYREQYQPYTIKPNSQNGALRNRGGISCQPIKFEGVSCYTSDYTQPLKAGRTEAPLEPAPFRAQLPFVGSSSYKDDYRGYRIEPQKPTEERTYRAPPVRFEGSTTYNEEYKGYQLHSHEEPNAKGGCIVEKLNVPTVNYINDQNHIYYDDETQKFV
jgi:hypothetical protein